FFIAGIGGLYLLALGIRRWCLRLASDFEVTRRMLAYFVRREVDRQAAARDPSEFRAIPESVRARLGAEGDTPALETDLVVDVAPEAFSRALHFARIPATSIVAIVAEAGAGKSHFLHRLCAEVTEESKCLRLEARHGSFAELMTQLAATLDLPSNSDEASVRAALAKEMHVVAIDDAHRLVRPTIGGLADLDALLAFARSIEGPTSWLLVIEDPAFAYVRRGRGEGALFDYVARLPRWSEEQLGALIRARTEQ
ncbi:MAG: AAA family ATPase, partial [bacterium]|nr:AAA family ATPase [bacterium]